MKGNIILTGILGEEQSGGIKALEKPKIKAYGGIVGGPSNYRYAIGHRGSEWMEVRSRDRQPIGEYLI